MHGSIHGLSYLDCLQSHSCVSKIKIDKGHAIKAIKLCSQYFTAVECFAQFYRIISFFALRKWYRNRCFVWDLSTLVKAQCGRFSINRNRCFVWDLSTLVKAQCGRFSRYVQLPWQQRLLPEIRMPDQHQSFLFQRCFSRTNMVVESCFVLNYILSRTTIVGWRYNILV